MKKIIKSTLKLKGFHCNGDNLKTNTGEDNIVEITGNAKSQIVNKVHELIRNSYDSIIETTEQFENSKPSIVVYVIDGNGQIIMVLLHNITTKSVKLGEEIYKLLCNREKKVS